MDLLHGGRIDGLCIVSSDGDFTRLAQRAREHGLIVIGIGANLSNRLRAACDDVVRIPTREHGSDAQVAELERQGRDRFVQTVRSAIEKVGQDKQGWALVTEVQKHVVPNFYRGEFRKALNDSPAFKVRKRSIGASPVDFVRVAGPSRG
jgi:hypothetical protein